VKVAICHQSFAYGDAIGNDMAGMYRLLQRLGMEPVIVCDHSQKDGFRISAPAATDWKSFEIIVYHHSLYWKLGEELIHHSACPIVFKYHNITPARFFKPYSRKIEEFETRDAAASAINMHTCRPTVYPRPHIVNFSV
jgi:hypothetical protein